MTYHLRLLSCTILLFSLLFTACRNEPKLEEQPNLDVVKVRMSSDPENLNFLLTAHASAIEIFKLISMPLCSFDPSTNRLSPTLVKQNPIIEEITEGEYKGRVAYDFEILEEAKWDNGTPITAADFVFTLKAIANPNYASPHRSLTAFIKDVEIDPENPKKFRVYGVKYILAAPVVSNFEIMPRYVYDPEGLLEKFTLKELKDRTKQEALAKDETLKKFATAFQSPLHLNKKEGISYAGPYKIDQWITGQEIVLVKKDNWWGDQLTDKYPLLTAKPKKIIIKFIPDINAAISLAKNGEIDVISRIEWSKFIELQKDKSITDNYNLHVPGKFAFRYIILNNANPKFSDKKVRKALDHLFNREEIGKTVYHGHSNSVIGPIHPSKPYYNKDLTVRAFDIEKAKALLAEAGWKDTNGDGIVDKMIDGEKVEMTLELLLANNYQDYVSMGAIFADAAKKAGVDITATSVESSLLFNRLKAKDFEGTFFGHDWYPLPKDLAGTFQTGAAQNYGSFSNAEADQLMKEIRFSIDDTKLVDKYKRVQEILHEEAASIFINTGDDRIIINKKFGDTKVAQVKPHYYLTKFGADMPVLSKN